MNLPRFGFARALAYLVVELRDAVAELHQPSHQVVDRCRFDRSVHRIARLFFCHGRLSRLGFFRRGRRIVGRRRFARRGRRLLLRFGRRDALRGVCPLPRTELKAPFDWRGHDIHIVGLVLPRPKESIAQEPDQIAQPGQDRLARRQLRTASQALGHGEADAQVESCDQQYVQNHGRFDSREAPAPKRGDRGCGAQSTGALRCEKIGYAASGRPARRRDGRRNAARDEGRLCRS